MVASLAKEVSQEWEVMLELEEMVGWAWSNLLTSTALPMSTESVTVAVHKFGTVETSILPILLLMAMMLTPVSPRSAARELREIQGNLVTLEKEEIQGWLDIKDRMGKRVKMDKMLRNSALCLYNVKTYQKFFDTTSHFIFI